MLVSVKGEFTDNVGYQVVQLGILGRTCFFVCAECVNGQQFAVLLNLTFL